MVKREIYNMFYRIACLHLEYTFLRIFSGFLASCD